MCKFNLIIQKINSMMRSVRPSTEVGLCVFFSFHFFRLCKVVFHFHIFTFDWIVKNLINKKREFFNLNPLTYSLSGMDIVH